MSQLRPTTRIHRAAGLAAATVLITGAGVGIANAGTQSHPTNTAPLVKLRTPTDPAKVTNVRFGSHSNYDRAVIDIQGAAPGYDVRYLTSQPRACGSGNKVFPAGTRFLQIMLQPADTHDGNYNDVYVGPGQTQSAKVGLATIKGMRVNCQFEGQVGIVLGLDHKAGFRVGTLAGPTRIYVDVSH